MHNFFSRFMIYTQRYSYSTMCDWRTKHFETQSRISGSVQYDGSGSLKISGTVRNAEHKSYIIFWAANPPDYRTSYSGSGLPYPNSEVAYEKSPNRGVVDIQSDGSFQFHLKYPSGYYTGLGTVYMQPHIFIQINSPTTIGKPTGVRVGEGTPFRLLTYPPIPETAPRCSPMFYAAGETQPVRTQEQILRDSGYPKTNHMPNNFWGLTPPH